MNTFIQQGHVKVISLSKSCTFIPATHQKILKKGVTDISHTKLRHHRNFKR